MLSHVRRMGLIRLLEVYSQGAGRQSLHILWPAFRAFSAFLRLPTKLILYLCLITFGLKKITFELYYELYLMHSIVFWTHIFRLHSLWIRLSAFPLGKKWVHRWWASHYLICAFFWLSYHRIMLQSLITFLVHFMECIFATECYVIICSPPSPLLSFIVIPEWNARSKPWAQQDVAQHSPSPIQKEFHHGVNHVVYNYSNLDSIAYDTLALRPTFIYEIVLLIEMY